ncbi:MAG: ABC transporter permease [Alphaproteobacteria bacterium]|nr:ABC transporter permease [Alphaproteobacteria bacterium]
MTEVAENQGPGVPNEGMQGVPTPSVRQFGCVNWRGLWTLYHREVKRFFKVFTQTLAAPVVTTLLFYTIFTVALQNRVGTVGSVPFAEFLAPGLIMMTILQNSFANTASSMMTSKIQGNIVDVLMPPISPLEMLCGFLGGGVTRGFIVGISATAAMSVLVDFPFHNIGAILFFSLTASVMLALLGMVGGIWAEKFDHMAAITNFVIVPMSFLSGTFYSIHRLPELWQTVAQFNPFFYAIDGFRYGFIGQGDAPFWLGASVMIGVNILLFLFVHQMLVSGYKLKS